MNLLPGSFLGEQGRKAQNLQLLGIDYVGRLGHRTHRVLIFWKSDDIPQGFRLQHLHGQTVQAEGKAAVGRRAVLKSVDHKAEPLLDLLLGKAQRLEHFPLDILLMNPHASAP